MLVEDAILQEVTKLELQSQCGDCSKTIAVTVIIDSEVTIITDPNITEPIPV